MKIQFSGMTGSDVVMLSPVSGPNAGKFQFVEVQVAEKSQLEKLGASMEMHTSISGCTGEGKFRYDLGRIWNLATFRLDTGHPVSGLTDTPIGRIAIGVVNRNKSEEKNLVLARVDGQDVVLYQVHADSRWYTKAWFDQVDNKRHTVSLPSYGMGEGNIEFSFQFAGLSGGINIERFFSSIQAPGLVEKEVDLSPEEELAHFMGFTVYTDGRICLRNRMGRSLFAAIDAASLIGTDVPEAQIVWDQETRSHYRVKDNRLEVFVVRDGCVNHNNYGSREETLQSVVTGLEAGCAFMKKSR